MRYPQTFVEDLRRQADIVRVVQDYVALKKKGANWMACCPFHKEKTPSFSVNPVKEIFYCFGCHKGGSVFTFIMEVERVSFPEAIRIVADKIGMPLPQLVEDSRFAAQRGEAEEVVQLNRFALEWWNQQLLKDTPEARQARVYLSKRGINDETREIFGLGYAPDTWEALSNHLRQKGAKQTQIERSGLVVKREEGGSYDRFRGRLIFPVFDNQSRPIAFGGRTLKPDDGAKYINSPETAAYTKGRNLFGLHLTRDDIRKQHFAILVEGYLDLIGLYQFGIRNVVASLGTALTSDQAKLLGRFTRKVVVNYDGDRPGVQAAKKSIEVLLAEDFDVKVLVLPDNADPDEFVRKFGAVEYQRRRGEAQPHIQFVIDQAVRDRNLQRPAEKAEAVEEVLPYVRAIRNRVTKRGYFDIAMDALRIDDLALRRELLHSVKTSIPVGPSVHEKIVRRAQLKPTAAEQRLLGLLFSDNDLRRGVIEILLPEDYADLATHAIFKVLIELEQQGQRVDYDTLIEKTQEDPSAKELLPMLFMSDTLHALNEHYAPEQCVSTFRLMKIDQRIAEIRTELAAAERAGDSEKVAALSAEQVDLTRRRVELLPKTEVMQSGI